MAKKIYVGNLSFKTTEEELRALFEQYGTVHSVNVITDRETGRPRGFGFVEMDGADAAIAALDQQDFGGRNLKVNEARPRESRPRGGGGGGGGGGRQNRW
ncbi:MAG: RNA-binding protein [bacterium]|nr:RNA-binding protein [bacterium]